MNTKFMSRRWLAGVLPALLLACGVGKESRSTADLELGKTEQQTPGCLDVGPGGCGCAIYVCVNGTELWYCDDQTGLVCPYLQCDLGCIEEGCTDHCAEG